MDDNGQNQTEADIFVPSINGITMFGERLYKIGEGYHNQFYFPTWSPDGETLGVLFSDGYYEPHYPALIRENGKILTCLQDPDLITDIDLPIQVIDDSRIVINIVGQFDTEEGYFDSERYLSFYNMETCMEESVFYNGKGERQFAVSSKMWLAIHEFTDDLCLNVYDEQGNLVYTDKNYRYFYYLTWSKDGMKLSYQAIDEKDDAFYIHDFQSGETILLGDNLIGASFSPDGEKIITQFIDHMEDQIIMIDLSTMERTAIGEGQDPAWRPE
jgi:hypothetical protein